MSFAPFRRHLALLVAAAMISATPAGAASQKELQSVRGEGGVSPAKDGAFKRIFGKSVVADDTYAVTHAASNGLVVLEDSSQVALGPNTSVLFGRLNDPTSDYDIHVAADVMLILSSRRAGGVGYTLLCGFFTRSPITATSGDVRALVRAACHFWKQPLFVYAGVNDNLARLPGIPLPARLRPPMLVQSRDLDPQAQETRFSRFQLIDSDFV